MKMNQRLLSYLRSLGLAADASDTQAWEFCQGLRGLQANIASALNYAEEDTAARTNCDLMIRSLGYDPANPSKLLEAEKPVTRTTPTTGSDGSSTNGDLEKRLRAEGAEIERKRRAEIEQYCTIAGCSDEFTRGLVNDAALSVEDAREKIFADHQKRTRADVPADMPGAPAGHSRSSVTGNTQEILEAAMLHRCGIDPTQRWTVVREATPQQRRSTPVELERAADLSYHMRSQSLEDFVRAAAQVDGINLTGVGRNDLMRTYCQRASHMSSAALVGVFTTAMSSQLLAAYEAAEDTTAPWVREADVANFKPNERTAMGKGAALSLLPRGSEADHTTFGDETETFKIARYAKQFVIDDQDIIDDAFGALNDFTPAELGEAARQLRPDLVYSILLSNPLLADSVALFAAARGNLTGSAALDGTTLGAARKRFRLLTQDGRNLNLMMKYAIIPPTLDDALDVLISSRELVGGSSAAPTKNPNAGKGIVPVVEARLENGVTDPTDPTGRTVHAGSASTWFGGIDGARKTIEVAYRRGTGRVPQLRSFVLTEGRWGIGWDINLDIGAAATGGWRGLAKMQSAAL